MSSPQIPQDPEEDRPLLLTGRFSFDMSGLRKLCVDPFPDSKTRPAIMDGLDELVSVLRAHRIRGELWIDGSFLTCKVDPNDSDVVLRLDWTFIEAASSGQLAALRWINSDLVETHRCDIYQFVEYPEDHPSFWVGEYLHAYWMRQWGFDRHDNLKGIAVVEL
jgi:hypothetical protein